MDPTRPETTTMPTALPACTALIVAAGRGERFGGDTPKQYATLGGVAVLRHTVQAFLTHPAIEAVRCVIHPDDDALYRAATDGLGLARPLIGGATRQESVRLGLEGLAASETPPARVLVHDGARPFPGERLITDIAAALAHAPGAIPALALGDTLKRLDGDRVVGTVDRDGLYRAQTPQGFRFAELLDVHRRFKGQNLTDDAALFERTDLELIGVAGDEANFKITSAGDLARAEQQLSDNAVWRTGFGYDMHRFADNPGAGGQVRLLGVDVPSAHALAGHSDADVGLHALCDALLGAIADGDIGEHFPPSDPRWKGADSAHFVTHALARISGRGGRVEHVDVTVVCERPKVAPYRAAMRARVAALLGLDVNRVSVKATTTEGLGPEGRGEGISATAVATVRLSG